MAALIDATTGYANDIADWTDTTPQPGSADSGTNVTNLVTPFLWPTFSLAPGAVLDFGGTRTVFVKTFEADTDPTLSLAGVLTWITFLLVGSLTFAANLLLSAQLLKRYPALMSAIAAFHADSFKQTNQFRAGALSFTGAVRRFISKINAATVSASGFFQSSAVIRYFQSLSGAISFSGLISIIKGLVFSASMSFLGTVYKLTNQTRTALLSSTAVIRKQTQRLYGAVLSFSSFLIGLVPIPSLLTAALSFSGFISTLRGKVFTASVSFITEFPKKALKKLIASEFFSTFFRRPRTKDLSGILSFIGTSVFPTFVTRLTSILQFFGGYRYQNLLESTLRISTEWILHSGNIFLMIFGSSLSFTRQTTKRIARTFSTPRLRFEVPQWWWYTPPQWGFRIKTLLLKQATVSFSVIWTRFYNAISAILSFSGDVVATLIHFAVVLRSSIAFAGNESHRQTVFGILLRSFLRFGSSTVKGWFDVFANIYTTVHMAVQRVFGYVTAQYRVTNIVRSPRDTQTIGTSPQLIDLSDLIDPPPILFIKNTDSNYSVEVDSVNTFDAFPQRIPPQKGIVLSPDTTTIYARSIGNPVVILLSPGEPSVSHRIRLDARLSLRGELM